MASASSSSSSSSNKLEDIIYESPKSPMSSEDDEANYEDLRVVAVIKQKNRDAISLNESSEKLKMRQNPSVLFGTEDKTNVRLKTELILLDEAPRIEQTAEDGHPRKRAITKFHGNNPRVIDLSDDRSKMELRRELKVAEQEVGNSELSTDTCYESRKRNVQVADGDDKEEEDDESADILSRLPPGTILIKQSGNCSSAAASATPRTSSREDSDYVHDSSKDSTGTNSSESSGTVSYNATGKVRRVQYRSVRSKKVVQVRRNPVRNKKKKPIDQDFTRPRQRLLSTKRKTGFVGENAGRKRARSRPTPYMNTRSVTRKMYTVGATYQAPTVNDALEWKEWPSHGMHERPIWHPQLGLAYEYNERNFVSSAEARTYREIIEDPAVIEVVSVDPRSERSSSLSRQRTRYYGAPPTSIDNNDNSSGIGILDEASSAADSSSFLRRSNSFRACMHGSFHSVLAYCARVVAPTYDNNTDTKIRSYSRIEDTPLAMKAAATGESSRNLDEIRAPSQHHTSVPSASNEIPATSLPSAAAVRVPKCLVVPRKTINLANVRNIQGNILQEVLNRSSKNTLIFLKPTDPPAKAVEKLSMSEPRTRRSGNDRPDITTRLDDGAISDEALMEMSSIYNNLVPSEEQTASTNYATRLVPTNIPVEYRISNETRFSALRRSDNILSRGSIDRATTAADDPSTRFARSNRPTEIAKILAEYNEKAADDARCAIGGGPGIGPSPSAYGVDRTASTASSRSTRFRGLSPVGSGRVTSQRGNDDDRAMDLTTARPGRVKRDPAEPPGSEESNKKWLRDLIEDTAILYCAAAGVSQGDVVRYINTLDSVQKMQWLGS